MTKSELEKKLVSIKDFPSEGIIFRDITPVLEDPKAFQTSIDLLKEEVSGIEFNKVVGPESRGFIFGCPFALQTNVGFVPARKPGKLPRDYYSETYGLEYGKDELQIHKSEIKKNDKILIVDDLLATGGTIQAICKMIEKAGAQVAGIVTLICLKDLNAVKKLKGYNVKWVLEY